MNLHQMLIVGRATKDGSILKTKEGKDFGAFTVAVNEYFETGERAVFYPVSVFNATHKKVDEIKKGDLIMVDGYPRVNTWLSKTGEAKGEIQVIASKFRLMK